MSGVIYYGPTLFDYRVSSEYRGILKAKMDIFNNTNAVVATIEKTIGQEGCTGPTCYMNVTYTTKIGETLKAKYFVDIGQGYFALELDAHWSVINYTIQHPNMGDFWLDFRRVFDEWGPTGEEQCDGYPDPTNCNADTACKWYNRTGYNATGSLVSLEQFCIINDELNRAEFSRIVFIFLLMAILIAFFNKTTGYDAANPGEFLLILTGIVLMGSIAGGVGGRGFFYYADFISPNVIPYESMRVFINNYVLLFYCMLSSIGYMLTQMRRGAY
jgi:hypothetical protein